MNIILAILATLLTLTNSVYAQVDSIYDQGAYRTFIVHLPTDYSAKSISTCS
jgi:hypothetical protein